MFTIRHTRGGLLQWCQAGAHGTDNERAVYDIADDAGAEQVSCAGSACIAVVAARALARSSGYRGPRLELMGYGIAPDGTGRTDEAGALAGWFTTTPAGASCAWTWDAPGALRHALVSAGTVAPFGTRWGMRALAVIR